MSRVQGKPLCAGRLCNQARREGGGGARDAVSVHAARVHGHGRLDGASGGEAQRLKLAGEMGRGQDDALFVFDEPTIGLHPENVATLMAVFERLVEAGATVIVIEHDLDVIRAADWMIDLGPGGGDAGGTVVFEGVPEDAPAEPRSVTGRHLGRRA